MGKNGRFQKISIPYFGQLPYFNRPLPSEFLRCVIPPCIRISSSKNPPWPWNSKEPSMVWYGYFLELPNEWCFHCTTPQLLFRTRFLKGRLALIQDQNFVRFCFLRSYALLRVTFCVIITASRSKGSTVFCNLELHVVRRENRAWNLA